MGSNEGNILNLQKHMTVGALHGRPRIDFFLPTLSDGNFRQKVMRAA
jgi:hypothetical protein